MFKQSTVPSSGNVLKLYTRTSAGGYRPAQPLRTESGREAARRLLLESYIEQVDHRGNTQYKRIMIKGVLSDSLVIASLAYHLKLSESLVARYLSL